MRTTLDLPDSLFKEVKTRAVQQGVKLKDLLATYIEAGLRVPLHLDLGEYHQMAGRGPAIAEPPASLPVRHHVKLPIIVCPAGAPKLILTGEDIDLILNEQEQEWLNETPGH